MRKGLQILNINPNEINTLRKDTYKRPFLSSLKTNIDFNISHSDGIVVCALGEQCKVGIDVETMDIIIPNEYQSVFTVQEFTHIRESQNMIATFFKYWTKKEAIMKADGRGFYLSPASFEALNDEVIIDENIWFLQTLDLDDFIQKHQEVANRLNDRYSCHIATNQEVNIRMHFLGEEDIVR